MTELIGSSVNSVTGDYSRGASGYWIENGELTFPVSEITIAGNLKDMYLGIIGIGNDVDRVELLADTGRPEIRVRALSGIQNGGCRVGLMPDRIGAAGRGVFVEIAGGVADKQAPVAFADCCRGPPDARLLPPGKNAPAFRSQVHHEHLHRAAFAVRFVRIPRPYQNIVVRHELQLRTHDGVNRGRDARAADLLADERGRVVGADRERSREVN